MGGKHPKELPPNVATCVSGAISGPVTNKKDEDLVMLRRMMKDDALLQSIGHQLSDGCNAVHKCAEKNRADLLLVLLTKTDQYEPPANFIDAQKAGGSTPLHIAAIRGFDNIAEILIEHGANPSALNENGQTPLDFCTHNLDLKDDAGGTKRRRSEAKERIGRMLRK